MLLADIPLAIRINPMAGFVVVSRYKEIVALVSGDESCQVKLKTDPAETFNASDGEVMEMAGVSPVPPSAT